MGIAELHKSEYGIYPDFIVSAPGTLPLLGEHTEAFDGSLLAIGMSLRVWIAVSPRQDQTVRLYASDLNERKRFSVQMLRYRFEDRWANYPKAALGVLHDIDLTIAGANVTISGSVPQGLGFGSSAALVTASLVAFLRLVRAEFEGWNLLDLCRRVELSSLEKRPYPSEYVVPVFGLSDAMIRFDTHSGRISSIPIELNNYLLVLTDSKIPRVQVDDELRQRIEDVRKCLDALGAKGEMGLKNLTVEAIDELMGTFPESTRRRCLFIVEETARIAEGVDALKRKDLGMFGKIINRSHRGLRNLYEISCPEIDWLVKRANELEGSLCSRMCGLGFGGCIMSVMTKKTYEEYRTRLEEYEHIFGFKLTVEPISIDSGVRTE